MSIIERAMQKAREKRLTESGEKEIEPRLVAPRDDRADTTTAVPAVSVGSRVESGETAMDSAMDSAMPFAIADEMSHTRRDMKRIVEIDMDHLRDEGYLAPARKERQVADEFRRIKWPLLNNISGRGGAGKARNNLLLVTSALPDEGKTFTALNLALSMVRDREIRVILVDADVAMPTLTPALGMSGAYGLTDVLDSPDAQISEATYRTTVNGLFYVPAGKWHDHAPEFFAGQRMEQVITELVHRSQGGVVVLDSPPLLATNEAQAVTKLVGQVLLVVRADSTEQGAITEALSLIHKSTPVNAVLNRVERSTLDRMYGHGHYYHGYGQSYGYGPRTNEDGGE